MVAPDYLHLSGATVPLTFWGGIGLTVTLLLTAALVALRGEGKLGSLSATWAPDGTIQNGKLRAAAGVVLLCLIVGIGYVGSHWPTSFLRSASSEPSGQKAAEFTVPLLSRLDHFILACDIAPPPPQWLQTGSPFVSVQRMRRKAISASASFMAKMEASERVLAALERRKCWAI
jgi:hypothetical protein